MSSTSRRFGTDVSNIPSDVLHKTPSKKITNKSQSRPKSKPAPRVAETKSSPLFDVMETLMDTFTFRVSIDDEITITSPVKLSVHATDELRYERDFLLQFQKFCMEPIDDLILEVRPGFVHPNSSMDQAILPSNSQAHSSSQKNHHSIKSSNVSSNMGHSDASEASNSAVGSAINSKQWRIKHLKVQKPREQDPRRLAARQKQIDIGMNTVGYLKFLESIPPSARTKVHPKIPDIYQVCSKRSWDGQVRKWRRQLHDFDPTPAAGQDLDDGLAQNAAGHSISNDSSEDECSDDEEGEVLDH